MYDVLLEYRCPDVWLVRASKSNTIVTSAELPKMSVDPKKECESTYVGPEDNGTPDLGQTQKVDKVNDRNLYTRFSFTLFSMFVSGSFLAGYSVKSFYIIVAYGLSGTVRLSLLFGTWKGFLYEITHPDPLIKVIEACYLYRFDQDLYNEEETYRMLQEVIRQPELLKALTGSSLRGSMDPMLDQFSEEDKKKYRHLEKLEARNKFDPEILAKMKQELTKKYKDDLSHAYREV